MKGNRLMLNNESQIDLYADLDQAPPDYYEVKPLSAAEAQRREELEAVITKNMGGFLAVAYALREIREKELFRTTHKLFGLYIKDMWEMARRTAYQYIDAANVVDTVKQIDLCATAHKNEMSTIVDNSFELPRFQVSPEEVLSILLAKRLLSRSADGMISRSIQMLGRKLCAQSGHPGLTETAMDECFSAVWNAYSPAQSEIFQKTADALLCGRPLEFTYRSPTGRRTRRIVEPHHLQHYMASWVLIAWCRVRNDWRKFYLARITDISVLNEPFEKKPASVWNHLLEGGFGIFQGKDLVEVTLRFTPFRAGWIREQTWHPDQKVRNLADGSLEMTLPVADFREIRMRILQFGADVEVIGPAELREEMAGEALRLSALYEKQRTE